METTKTAQQDLIETVQDFLHNVNLGMISVQAGSDGASRCHVEWMKRAMWKLNPTFMLALETEGGAS